MLAGIGIKMIALSSHCQKKWRLLLIAKEHYQMLYEMNLQVRYFTSEEMLATGWMLWRTGNETASKKFSDSIRDNVSVGHLVLHENDGNI